MLRGEVETQKKQLNDIQAQKKQVDTDLASVREDCRRTKVTMYVVSALYLDYVGNIVHTYTYVRIPVSLCVHHVHTEIIGRLQRKAR